jgi:hypothetical protein
MATKTKTGFAITCPYCNEEDSTVTIQLADLTACHCSSCDEEFSPADAVRKMEAKLAEWLRVQKWVELAAEI